MIFSIYCGPIVLKKILDDVRYAHFLKLHSAIRLLSHPNAIRHVPIAEAFLGQFVSDARLPQLYGQEFTTLNVHCLSHLYDDVRYTESNLIDISAFDYENFLGSIKRKISSPNYVLARYIRRLHVEMQIIDHTPKIRVNIEILKNNGASIQKIMFNQQTFSSKHPDNTALLNNNKIAKIHKIFKVDDEIFIRVQDYVIDKSAFRFQRTTDVYSVYDSKALSYFEIKENPRTSDQDIHLVNISKKMVKFHVSFFEEPKRTFVVPVLH